MTITITTGNRQVTDFTAYIEPPLTTVRLDRDRLGQEAIRYLIKLIETPETPRNNRIIMPELIIRETARCLTCED